MRAILIAAALLTATAPAALAQQAAAPVAATAPANAFERDRQSILAQAGQYRVHFDMRENVSFRADYDPLEEKLSGGSEIVRVVYDKGDKISLQHILVMEHGGQTVVVKHWRQDWTYQPETVLTYAGPNQWTLTPVPADQRAGAWSQTVWQTDDSPRYGGVGHWTYDNGLSAWTSNPTWRPLARRDAVRNPVYDRYLGTNRHILKPDGWVHIQDNMKMSGKAGGEPSPSSRKTSSTPTTTPPAIRPRRATTIGPRRRASGPPSATPGTPLWPPTMASISRRSETQARSPARP